MTTGLGIGLGLGSAKRSGGSAPLLPNYAVVDGLDAILFSTGVYLVMTPDYPVFTVQPSISPSIAIDGDIVTIDEGVAVGATLSIAYFTLDGVDITSSLVGMTYTTTSDGILRLQVRAHNASGDTYSDEITSIVEPAYTTTIGSEADITTNGTTLTIIIASPSPYAGTYTVTIADLASGPVNIFPAVISGASAYGSTLTEGLPGIWVNDAALGVPTIARKWRAGVADISGATGATYQTIIGQVGQSVNLYETVTDSGGSRSQASNGIIVT